MGELLERVKLSNLVNGNGVADAYKNNSLYFYQKYQRSDSEVQAIPLSKIEAGRFHFFHLMIIIQSSKCYQSEETKLLCLLKITCNKLFIEKTAKKCHIELLKIQVTV